MHFAVLGTDPDILALVAVARAQGHNIAWLGDVRPEDAGDLAQLAPGLPVPSSTWETLLDRSTADGILIGRGNADPELRAEQLKRLAADAVPMLVVHPISDSVLMYYEIDMLRRETRGLVQHYNPQSTHPVLLDLAAWVAGSHPIGGAIYQISCERHLFDTTRPAVLAAMARDVELLALVAGDIRRVSAFGPSVDAASFATLQVQMTTPGNAAVRWSVAPQTGGRDSIDLVLVGERGRLSLSAPNSEQTKLLHWSLDERILGPHELRELPAWNPAAAAIERFAAAVGETDAERRAEASTWDKATQAMEVVDAVELSLQKVRTMEVHQQQLTEQMAFRGTMAAIGCGLLLVGFAVFVVATLVGGIEAVVDRRLLPGWPIILLAVLAFFLLLQAMPLLVSKAKPEAKRNAPDQ